VAVCVGNHLQQYESYDRTFQPQKHRIFTESGGVSRNIGFERASDAPNPDARSANGIYLLRFSSMRNPKQAHDRLFLLAETLLSSTWLRHVYVKFFDKATLEEFSEVAIVDTDQVVHIGCGPLPNSLISLARRYPATFVGIDRDARAVTLARKLVGEYGISNVTIHHGDALDCDVAQYDLIIVSYGVGSEEALFSRLGTGMARNARAVYRKQWNVMDLLYGRRFSLPEGFEEVAVHNRRDLIQSHLLKKI
jgi:hypothetical protein